MKNKLITITTQVTLALLTVQILIIISVWRSLPPEIPLLYSHPWGEDQLAVSPGIIILPIASLVVFLTNSVIAKLATKEEVLIKQMLTLTSLVFSFLIFISLVQIIRLIT